MCSASIYSADWIAFGSGRLVFCFPADWRSVNRKVLCTFIPFMCRKGRVDQWCLACEMHILGLVFYVFLGVQKQQKQDRTLMITPFFSLYWHYQLYEHSHQPKLRIVCAANDHWLNMWLIWRQYACLTSACYPVHHHVGMLVLAFFVFTAQLMKKPLLWLQTLCLVIMELISR